MGTTADSAAGTAAEQAAQAPGRLARELALVLPALHRALDRRVGADFPHPKPAEGQIALMRLIRDRDGITVREAAEAMLVKPNNLSATVTQMVGAGLVERRRDPDDKRVTHLHLTPTAAARTHAVDGLIGGYVDEALATLNDGERAALGAAVGALRVLERGLHPAGS
ncbi:MarR family winged helix-turn-helix transcriptional regulator [Streptomyces sp. NPDC058372]|uniref:MarR family winged helix-turn-helix transcriptional regulator n=1 Tax=Streptomyces sp. NPDC058372 TaxID=3346464 RepID=UPI00366722D3